MVVVLEIRNGRGSIAAIEILNPVWTLAGQ